MIGLIYVWCPGIRYLLQREPRWHVWWLWPNPPCHSGSLPWAGTPHGWEPICPSLLYSLWRQRGEILINPLIDTDSIQSVSVPWHYKWQINTKTWIILFIYVIANAICRHMKKNKHFIIIRGIIKTTYCYFVA